MVVVFRYKLVTRDMGPRTRCLNADAPPAQPWQYPLPPPPADASDLADFGAVAAALTESFATPQVTRATRAMRQKQYCAGFVWLGTACGLAQVVRECFEDKSGLSGP